MFFDCFAPKLASGFVFRNVSPRGLAFMTSFYCAHIFRLAFQMFTATVRSMTSGQFVAPQTGKEENGGRAHVQSVLNDLSFSTVTPNDPIYAYFFSSQPPSLPSFSKTYNSAAARKSRSCPPATLFLNNMADGFSQNATHPKILCVM